MPGITFSADDIASANQLDAAWYPAIVKSCVEGPGKKDPQSTTWATEFRIAEGPAAGTIVQHWFSDKMMKDIVIYSRCFQKPEPGKSFPIDATVGKPVKIYARWDLERKTNVIMDFQPAAKAA